MNQSEARCLFGVTGFKGIWLVVGAGYDFIEVTG
jgi:hypothetical protein